MKRIEFERCAPEEVGISSEDVLKFVKSLDDGFTEMHSLMIMRHGKIVAEGWWAPYHPGMRHTMMSQTKTYTGTAIGIAADEGILSLDERIVDIFKEHVPDNVDEKLKRITIRDLLCMASGMVEASLVDDQWLDRFFQTEVVYEPGTSFFYNDSAVTLLAAIIQKKSGQSLFDYLKPRLFEPLGIDAEHLNWFSLADGTHFAAGGLFCRTEDTLRLMKMYLDGGIFAGQRILSEDYVKAATQPQIRTDQPTTLPQGLPEDNRYGYGYLMWMSHIPGIYRAEGAYGQITLVDPGRDMILSFTQSTKILSPASQGTLDRCWQFLATIDPEVHVLPQNTPKASQLARHLRSLAIECSPFGSVYSFPALTYQVEGEGIHPENLFYDQLYHSSKTAYLNGITRFRFQARTSDQVIMEAELHHRQVMIQIPTDGSRLIQDLDSYYTHRVAVSGYWQDPSRFAVRFRWVETPFEKELVFHFDDHQCWIEHKAIAGRFPRLGAIVQAKSLPPQ